MRIVFILSSCSLAGGSTKSFLSSCRELAKDQSMHIWVVCPNMGGVYRLLKQKKKVSEPLNIQSRGLSEFGDTQNGSFERSAESRVEVVAIPLRTNTYPLYGNVGNALLFPLRFLFHVMINHVACVRLQSLCKKIKPDVICTNVSVVNIGEVVARRLCIPHVYYIREYQYADFGMRIIPSIDAFRRHLRKERSICITRGIQEYFGLNGDNSEVIYDGVKYADDIVFDKDKEQYFLFVGRLDESKGVRLVLDAFAKSNIAAYKLKIAGASLSLRDNDALKEYTKQLGIAGKVDFLGVLPNVDLLMRRATALIMASQSEGFGRVTSEAMFNGCLVLGRDVAGTKEQFDNGLKWTGGEIGIRWNTVEELKTKMVEITNNGIEKYYSYIERGLDACVHYSIEQNVCKLENFFRTVANRGTRI